MTVKEAKGLDMVKYLSQLGYEPEQIKGQNFWYLSPLRNETTPSFKINVKLNRWFDWGEGRGGNLVDFGVLYYRCSVSEFLKKLDVSNLQLSNYQKQVPKFSLNDEKNQIKILKVRPITSFPLLCYLQKRRISHEIADQYCSEVSYELNNKNYYAIGFPNNTGGYELRNEYIKASSAPKDITFIDHDAENIAVFEGFFNFLSYQTLYHKEDTQQPNFLILNSTSFFEKALPLMQSHSFAHLYLDNDKTGRKFTQKALQLDKEKFKDERSLYQKYNDLNDWLINFGQSSKHRLQVKL